MRSRRRGHLAESLLIGVTLSAAAPSAAQSPPPSPPPVAAEGFRFTPPPWSTVEPPGPAPAGSAGRHAWVQRERQAVAYLELRAGDAPAADPGRELRGRLDAFRARAGDARERQHREGIEAGVAWASGEWAYPANGTVVLARIVTYVAADGRAREAVAECVLSERSDEAGAGSPPPAGSPARGACDAALASLAAAPTGEVRPLSTLPAAPSAAPAGGSGPEPAGEAGPETDAAAAPDAASGGAAAPTIGSARPGVLVERPPAPARTGARPSTLIVLAGLALLVGAGGIYVWRRRTR